MHIKYNHLSILIISISIFIAIASYAFAKTKSKCFTCLCKNNRESTVIMKPNCNFDSLFTNKSINDLPSDIQKKCTQDCHHQNQAYVKYLIWSE